jgi:hypothetical protein
LGDNEYLEPAGAVEARLSALRSPATAHDSASSPEMPADVQRRQAGDLKRMAGVAPIRRGAG